MTAKEKINTYDEYLEWFYQEFGLNNSEFGPLNYDGFIALMGRGLNPIKDPEKFSCAIKDLKIGIKFDNINENKEPLESLEYLIALRDQFAMSAPKRIPDWFYGECKWKNVEEKKAFLAEITARWPYAWADMVLEARKVQS